MWKVWARPFCHVGIFHHLEPSLPKLSRGLGISKALLVFVARLQTSTTSCGRLGFVLLNCKYYSLFRPSVVTPLASHGMDRYGTPSTKLHKDSKHRVLIAQSCKDQILGLYTAYIPFHLIHLSRRTRNS